MRDFPSCFGENGVRVSDTYLQSTIKTAQNLVSCVYRCKSRGKLCLVPVTWTKNLMGQALSIGIDNLCKVDIKPWLFSRKKGCRNLELEDSTKIDIFWNLTNAKFGAGPEPLENFYLAIVFDRQEMVLLIGDLENEAHKKIELNPVHKNAIFIGKREYFWKEVLWGKSSTSFCDKGKSHDVLIECESSHVGVNDPSLVIRIDGKIVMQIKRLRWKFRGNQTIIVDGVLVEVFWDVHNWLFGNAMSNNAVFMFQTCLEKSVFDSSVSTGSSSRRSKESQLHGSDFSLILCAWKTE